MTEQARSREVFARSLGVGALVLFVLVVWWADTRSHAQQGFDWRKAQREYFAREGLDERPRVIRRAIVVDEQGTTAEEMCETCHVGADKTHPGTLLAAHPKNVGCTHCHGGTPGELSTAAHARKDLRVVSCAGCHGLQVDTSNAARRADADKVMADVLTGARIYRERQCGQCHEWAALGFPAFPGERRPAMPLTDLDVRRRPEQVLAWLLYPSRMDPHATMPRVFEGRPVEALAVTAYLLSGAMKKDASLREDAEQASNVTGASADDGARLYAALGCSACHASAPAPDAVDGTAAAAALGPSLADIGRKTTEGYLAAYLRDPSRVHPRTRMASFRLDAREAASLGKYLATMVPKEPLPLTAAEAASLTAKDLTTARIECSGNVLTTRVECGERFYRARCVSCHDPASRQRPTELLRLLTQKRPTTGTFHQNGVTLDYALSAPERAAVSAFLQVAELPPAPLGARPRSDAGRTAVLRGQEIVDELGCRACHGTPEKSARITSRHAPPSLEHEGERSRPEWLFAFLRKPSALGVRPAFHPEWVYGRLPPLDALAPRMPTFALTEDETTAVVRSLTGATESYPFTDTRPRERSPEERLAAFVLLNRGDDRTRCTSCHFTADIPLERMKQDAASVAPGFNGLVLRRRPEWVMKLIPAHDASHYAADKPRPAWSDKDAALVTDVLFSLDDRGKLPRAGEEGRAPLP